MTRLSADFKSILAKIPEDRQTIAKRLIEELKWMQRTLAKLRTEVDERGVIEEFQNGKQHFVKDSAALKAYNTTIQRYGNIYKQLTDLMNKIETPKESDDLIDFIKQ